MADFAPLKSAEFTSFSASPRSLIPSYKWGGKMRSTGGSLTFTAAGATGTAKMCRLPAGKVRVLKDLCRIVCPAGTATSDLHVGYAAHVSGATGAAVVGDDNAFADNLDVGGAAIDAAFTLPAITPFFDFDSADGVDIEIMIDTAASPASGVCHVSVVYVQGN
jgi:hypothetical protein